MDGRRMASDPVIAAWLGVGGVRPDRPFGVTADGWVQAAKNASSAESVGRFWFRESSQVVIKGNFHSLVGTKAVGSSGNHSDFVVETLNGAIGDFSFGSKPIQDQ